MWKVILLEYTESVKPEHRIQCSEGIAKLEDLEKKLTDKGDELKLKRGDLYVGNMLKKPGMDEKDDFLKNEISELNDLSERCNCACTDLNLYLKDCKMHQRV